MGALRVGGAGDVRTGVGQLPVVMKGVARACWGMVWASDRTTVHLSITAPRRRKCSQRRSPCARVAIGRNSPRMPSGASGFKSHMSVVEGPTTSQTKITECACGPQPDQPARFGLQQR